MAASQRSLALTEAFRTRTFAIRERLQAQAGRGWPTIETLDATDWPERMAATVAAGQVEAVRVTSGYLGAFITSETGRRTRPLEIDPRAYSGRSRDGRGLTDSLRSPLIGVLAALKDSDPTEALRQGLIRAQRMVGVDFDHAHRTALLEAIERDERFEGWERAVRGTCGACAGKATGPTGGLRFEVHPGCQCVTEPVVAPRSPEEVLGTGIIGSAEGQIVERFLGTAPGSLPYTRQVNALLRGLDASGEFSAAQLKDMVRKMDLALRQKQVGAPIQTWRQVKGLDFEVGRTFTDAGFGSTSANNLYKSLGEVPGGANLNLTVSPEVRAAWGANPVEAELLLERGCRYVVKTKTKNKGGGWDIEATVLPPA